MCAGAPPCLPTFLPAWDHPPILIAPPTHTPPPPPSPQTTPRMRNSTFGSFDIESGGGMGGSEAESASATPTPGGGSGLDSAAASQPDSSASSSSASQQLPRRIEVQRSPPPMHAALPPPSRLCAWPTSLPPLPPCTPTSSLPLLLSGWKVLVLHTFLSTEPFVRCAHLPPPPSSPCPVQVEYLPLSAEPFVRMAHPRLRQASLYLDRGLAMAGGLLAQVRGAGEGEGGG